MSKVIGWIKGTVTFRAEGGFCERLLDEATKENIPLWDTVPSDTAFTARCFAADYRRLRPLFRKAQMRVRLSKRQGAPFAFAGFRGRWGLAVGMIVAFYLFELLSSRVWVINVTGNETLSEEAILRTLSSYGVAVGCDFNEADVAALRLSALQALPDLAWLAANQDGCVLTVQVREKNESPPISPAYPADLVAACDGVIEQLTVTAGVAAVKSGDTVKAGDLLITGAVPTAVGDRFTHAAGTVIAHTEHVLTERVPLYETVTETVLSSSPLLSFQVFSLSVPLYTDRPSLLVKKTQTQNLTLFGTKLPVSLCRSYEEKAVTHPVARTEKQAEDLARLRLALRKAGVVRAAGILGETEQVTLDGGTVTVQKKLSCLEEIAAERKIENFP